MIAGSHAAKLLEREAEMATLDRLLAAAASGRGGVLLVEGAAGVGKSALLRELGGRGRAAPARVLTAVGGELEREFPFGMVRQLLEPVVLGAGPERRAELLSGSAALAGPVIGAAPQAEGPAGADASFATLHGLYWLVAALGDEQPLVLVLDDAHWADAPSLRFADFLARRITELPVLLAIGLRPNEPGAEEELIRALLGTDGVELMRPRPLSRAAVGELVGGELSAKPDSGTADAAHEATGGNPLLVRELLRALGAEGRADAAAVREAVPSSVTRSVGRRLKRLPADARAVASALAVLGDRIGHDLLARTTGLEAAAVARALDSLQSAELVAGEPPGYVHPLIRHAVAETVTLADRHAFHRRAIDASRERPGATDQLVVHLLAIPPIGEPWVVDLLREAAWQALADGAPEAAVRRLERALEESGGETDPALALELGLAEATTGAPGAVRHLDEAAASSEPAVAAAAVQARGSLANLIGGSDKGALADALGEAIGRLDPDRSPELVSELYGTLLNTLSTDSRLGARRERVLAEAAHLEWETLLGARAQEGASREAAAGEVIELASRALASRPFAELGKLERPTLSAIAALWIVDGRDLADAAITDAEATARRHGSRLARGFATWMRSEWSLAFGSIAMAEANARETLALWTETSLDLMAAFGSASLAQALVLLGRVDEADTAIAPVRLAEHETIDGHVLQARAAVRLGQQRFDEAVADLRRVQTLCDAFGWRQYLVGLHRPQLAIALARAGERAEAVDVAAGEIEFAVRTGRGSVEVAGRIALGLALEGADSTRAFAQAVEASERSRSPLLRAQALVEHGAALRREGQRVESRDVLRAGHDIAASIGARALQGRALEELTIAGAKPRKPLSTGVESLTPSERRVAEHAARGLSNREIAETLFVTRKTVELHLGRTYAKLEIRSRAQLAGVLGEPATDVPSAA